VDTVLLRRLCALVVIEHGTRRVHGDSEQTLCVYNVEPGSETAQALQVLGSWNAPAPIGPDAPCSR
jgi:hypothetical protein